MGKHTCCGVVLCVTHTKSVLNDCDLRSQLSMYMGSNFDRPTVGILWTVCVHLCHAHVTLAPKRLGPTSSRGEVSKDMFLDVSE